MVPMNLAPNEPTPDPEDMALLVEKLPKELGALLLSVGALGWVLPGMVGIPALIAGGMIFWPKTFGPIEGWFGKKYPKVHRQSVEQIRRYLEDLERRYPNAPRS